MFASRESAEICEKFYPGRTNMTMNPVCKN
jgi:hypothetical protein